jgi:hypothetical protein
MSMPLVAGDPDLRNDEIGGFYPLPGFTGLTAPALHTGNKSRRYFLTSSSSFFGRRSHLSGEGVAFTRFLLEPTPSIPLPLFALSSSGNLF